LFDIIDRFIVVKFRLNSYQSSWFKVIRKNILDLETFEKCSILFKFKEGENFKYRNTLSISRLKI